MKRTTYFNEALLNNITPEFAYFLGYFWADGYLSKQGKTKSVLVLEIVEKDANSIKHIIDKIGIFSFWQRKTDNRIDQKRQKSTIIRVSNKNLYSFLVEFNYLNKKNQSFKKILEYIPIKLQKYFIRGYFDGDGCIFSNKNEGYINFASTYEQDWEFLLNYLSKFEISTYVIKRKEGGSILISSKKLSIINFFKNFYSEDNIYLKRKYDKLKEHVKYIETLPSVNKPIIQLTLNDVPIKEWESARKASRELNIHQSSILNVLKERCKTGKGYKWKYK